MGPLALLDVVMKIQIPNTHAGNQTQISHFIACVVMV
jgi:hypothetical protein